MSLTCSTDRPSTRPSAPHRAGRVRGVAVSCRPGPWTTVENPVNAGTYEALAHLEHADYTAADAQGWLAIKQASSHHSLVGAGSHYPGSPWSSSQLNASATGVGGVALGGSLASTPRMGTVPVVGTHSLQVQFLAQRRNYAGASKTVPVSVVYN